MTSLVKIWDNGAEPPAFVEMLSIKGKEAVARDPKRYSREKPEPAPVAPVSTFDSPDAPPPSPKKPGRPPNPKGNSDV